jgi:hypothetical protein
VPASSRRGTRATPSFRRSSERGTTGEQAVRSPPRAPDRVEQLVQQA